MDYRSLDPAGYHPVDLWRNQWEERGQTAAFCYAPDQRWYYLDSHTPDEVTLIKIWDSRQDVVGKRKSTIPLLTSTHAAIPCHCLRLVARICELSNCAEPSERLSSTSLLTFLPQSVHIQLSSIPIHHLGVSLERAWR